MCPCNFLAPVVEPTQRTRDATLLFDQLAGLAGLN
jgi:hypothetical protein